MAASFYVLILHFFSFHFLSQLPLFPCFVFSKILVLSLLSLFPIRTHSIAHFCVCMRALAHTPLQSSEQASNFLALAFINLDAPFLWKLTLNSFTNQFRLHMYAFFVMLAAQ